MNDGSVHPSGDTLVGHTLAGRYQLTRKIGEGGMGAVYEAEHVVIGKPVAVKVLRDKYLDRPEVAQRLVQEARLASSIRHEHIVDITDSGVTDDGRTFVVMEQLAGSSLAELIHREGGLPESRTIAIALQAASALGAAHERGIVHRDVKPENIFICERDGRDFVKVVDFGISKSLKPGGVNEDSLRLTHTGMVLGTPLYMSPEQARGEDDLDHRIDVYALGVILYECLTGEVPFRGGNYLGVIAQVVSQTPPAPRALRPEMAISEAMEQVVQTAMAKERAARYPSMEALAADLERVAAGESVAAASIPPPTRPRRVRAGWLVAGGLAAGAALLLVDHALFAPAAPRSPLPTVVTPARAAPEPAAPAPPRSVVVHIETTPAGAEVRQGNHVYGATPRDLVLPRSDAPLRLDFRLDGYEQRSADVVPSADHVLQLELAPRRRRKPAHAPPKPAAAPAAPAPAPSVSEVPPNPYRVPRR